MSLGDAVLMIADAMDARGKWLEEHDSHGDLACMELAGYATQLRCVVKASASAVMPAGEGEFRTPEDQHRHYINKFRAEFRRERQGPAEELPPMLQLVGGGCDGDVVPSSVVDAGAAFVAGQWYVLRDGKLHYSEEETLRRRKA